MKKMNVRWGIYAIMLLVFSTIPASLQAASDKATITISGKVLANTCSIDSNSANAKVTLNNISDRDIKGVGKTGGEKTVEIILKDCGSNIDHATITTFGDTDGGGDAFTFKNRVKAGATGVGLYFYQTESGDTKFKPDGSVKKDYKLNKGSNTLKFRAAYVGTSDTVTAGDFQALVNLTIEYY